MANTNRPFGLRPVGTIGHAAYVGKVQRFYVPADNANAIFIGDTVVLAGTSDVQRIYPDDSYSPEAAVGAAASVVAGVCVGVEPVWTDLSINYRKASTAMYIYVDVDPMTVYSMQGDSTVFTVANAAGLNATITATGGDTATGRSKFVLTNPQASATEDLLVLNADPAPDNEIGAYMRFLVKLNLHQFGPGIVRVGIS